MAIYKDVASLEVVGYTVPKNGTFDDGVQFILEKLDAIPEADVEPVRHGHWIYIGTDKIDNIFTCSECGRRIKNPCYETTAIVKIRFPYCNCGAKMDGKETEDEQ